MKLRIDGLPLLKRHARDQLETHFSERRAGLTAPRTLVHHAKILGVMSGLITGVEAEQITEKFTESLAKILALDEEQQALQAQIDASETPDEINDIMKDIVEL